MVALSLSACGKGADQSATVNKSGAGPSTGPSSAGNAPGQNSPSDVAAIPRDPDQHPRVFADVCQAGDFERRADVTRTSQLVGLPIHCSGLDEAGLTRGLDLVAALAGSLPDGAYRTIVLSDAFGADHGSGELRLDAQAAVAAGEAYLRADVRRASFEQTQLAGVRLRFATESAEILDAAMSGLAPYASEIVAQVPALREIVVTESVSYVSEMESSIQWSKLLTPAESHHLFASVGRKARLQRDLGGIQIHSGERELVRIDEYATALERIEANRESFLAARDLFDRIELIEFNQPRVAQFDPEARTLRLNSLFTVDGLKPFFDLLARHRQTVTRLGLPVGVESSGLDLTDHAKGLTLLNEISTSILARREYIAIVRLNDGYNSAYDPATRVLRLSVHAHSDAAGALIERIPNSFVVQGQ